MDIIYYNELDYSTVEKQFKKVVKYLSTNNFASADIKKIANTDYYRARLDKKNRLLFKFAKYEGKSYILLLEVILNHDYDKSKFLRGKIVDDENSLQISEPEQVIKEDVKQLVYLNKKSKHFNILDKIISFDNLQDEIYSLPTPLVIIGSAGSGKTIITLEKLKKLRGNVAYISLSAFLVENAQNVYYSNNYENDNQEVDFLSFHEYVASIKIPKGGEIKYQNFEQWFAKHNHGSKFNEPFKLYEEFKGVLTGAIITKPYLSRADYNSLGIKQSIFNKQERDAVYDIFEKYIKFLSTSSWYDLNVLSYEYLSLVEQKYDFIVIDEVQDITIVQLKLILNSLKAYNRFLLSGDSNQIVHPNFFSWAKIKTLFYESSFDFSLIRILRTNYRNSQKVTELSNILLRIKNTRFGSIDKESTYLINSISEKKGDVLLLNNNNKSNRQLNSKTQNSTKFAVLVMNNKDKALAKKSFKTPLIFSIQEAKGLEYDNIILFNFISSYEKEFKEITRDVTAEMLEDELKYSRAKNKEDKDLEVYKFFINSLYVAFTRSIKNLYLIETQKNHRIFELLKLKEEKQSLKIETQKSDANEWLDEADKLEKQGKLEQANQIRAKISGVQYLTEEEYNALKIKALDKEKTEREVKRERKDLYRHAVARLDFDSIEKLADLDFARAIAYMRELKADQKILEKNCRLNRKDNLKNIIKEYGINFRSSEKGMTGLMLSLYYSSENMVDFFLERNADVNLMNTDGKNAYQIVIEAMYRREVMKNKNEGLDVNAYEKYTQKLQASFMRYNADEKLYKIHKKSMQYFLLNYFTAVSDIVYEHKLSEARKNAEKEAKEQQRNKKYRHYDIPKHDYEFFMKSVEKGFSVDDIVKFVEKLPETVMPEFRKKRQYISSMLSSNEVERDFIYNRKIFKRIKRGFYIMNPDLEILD